MKKLNFINALFLAAVLFLCFSNINAQNQAPDAAEQKSAENRRPNLLDELSLTQEQIRQIRVINTENKPSMHAAQQRLRAANQNLDRAIYADNIDEAGIQTLVKEVQAAQIEVIKLRSATELSIRRILTAEQLVKFRDLRQQFIEKMENRQNQPRNHRLNFSNRKFGNRQPETTQTN